VKKENFTMRRGWTVEIKMSSATACTGVWQFCLSWVCRHTLVATAAKVLSPKQLEVRWTVRVLVSAERMQ